ncbi:tRNA-guanine transglycosylase DpdA [Persephonella sp.]
MKYFLPYWEDWVHKDFDPVTEDYKKSGFENSIFAHEILVEPIYDGILVSLGLFELKLKLIKENGLPKIRNFYNIREYLRLPAHLYIMGDCGAFTYINEKNPVIDVEKAVYHYDSLGFDYGISVDHICSDVIVLEDKRRLNEFSFVEATQQKSGKFKIILTQEEKEYRRKVSIENAYKFLKLSKDKSFIPIGAVQGYSIETYIDSAKQLIEQGYEYLAFGGLVPKKTEFISQLLDKINKEIDITKIKIHLLGVLRENLLKKMKEYNIYSFDSASYYRKSWLRATQNYLGIDKNWYSAIRVPQSQISRTKNKISESISLYRLVEKEEKILKLLREFDKGNIRDIDSILEEVISYDKFFLRDSFNEEKFFSLYKETLESKIWKSCDCKICQSLGIDVVIFRGANRNKRRGFHNTYVFYRKILNNKEDSVVLCNRK